MSFLIVSATNEEIEPLTHTLGKPLNQSGKITAFQWENTPVEVLVTGVGMVATAYWVGIALNNKKYQAAINLGLCGSFDQNLKIGTVVEIVEDELAEIGAEDDETFIPIKDLALSTESACLVNESKFPISTLDRIPKAKGITVNKVHGNISSIERTYARLQPQTESMEGAAFFYACQQSNLPYCQIRAVSNYVEKRNKDNWDIPLAIKRLNLTALEVLNEIVRL